MAGPYAFTNESWWQRVQREYFSAVPSFITAVIAQGESSGTPSALGDFVSGYDDNGRPVFSQTGGGRATSFGVWQLHGSVELGPSTFIGQGTAHSEKQMMDPFENSRIAAQAIVPAYLKARTALPTGYVSQVASTIGETPDANFLVLARTAALSGHTIPLTNLWRDYKAYTKSFPSDNRTGIFAPPLSNYRPGQPDPFGNLTGTPDLRGTGHFYQSSALEHALVMAATPVAESDDWKTTVKTTTSKAVIGLFGVVIAALVVGAGIWTWKGQVIAKAAGS